jgi:hypothetical protein
MVDVVGGIDIAVASLGSLSKSKSQIPEVAYADAATLVLSPFLTYFSFCHPQLMAISNS